MRKALKEYLACHWPELTSRGAWADARPGFIIELMSESAAHREDGWWGTRQVRTPPVPVWVDLRRALPPQQVGVRTGTAMRIRAAGVDNSRLAPGVLLAWQQTATGDRWAQVRAELVNRNEHARMIAELWVPQHAVQRRDEAAEADDELAGR